MFRFYALPVAAILFAVVAASPIRVSSSLERSSKDLHTAVRHGSDGSMGGNHNDELDDRAPHGKDDDNRGKKPSRGSKDGHGKMRGPVVECDPWDPDCKKNDIGEEPTTMGPGNPDKAKKDHNSKGPMRRKMPGHSKDRRPRPVKKCDPWDPDCSMEKDDDEPACDPWDPNCAMKVDDDDETPCDPWDPNCGTKDDNDDVDDFEDEPGCNPWNQDCEMNGDDVVEPDCDPWDPDCGIKNDDDDEPECDPWKVNCKEMSKAKAPRGNGPQDPKSRPGGGKGKSQTSGRRNNRVRRRRRGAQRGPREQGGKEGRSHGKSRQSRGNKDGRSRRNKGGSSNGSGGGKSHGNKGGPSHGRENTSSGRTGHDGGKGGKGGKHDGY